MMIKFRQAFRAMPESERQIKFIMVFSCSISLAALFFMVATNTFGKFHSSNI